MQQVSSFLAVVFWIGIIFD